MNELALRVKQNPGTIELNFKELNEQMDAKLAEYEEAAFTEETKDIAKAEVASLRKLKKDVEDARKSVKKEWCKPLDVFEGEMKTLSAKVDEPIELIGKQLEEFEEKRKAEKKREIVKAYEEIIGGTKEYLPLDRIYDPKWENVSTTMKSIREGIETEAGAVDVAVATISSMPSDAVGKALELYKSTLDMAKAIAYVNDYERQRAEIVKREGERRRAEEERQKETEIERARAAGREAAKREEEARHEAAVRREPECREEEPTDNPFLKPGGDQGDELPFEQPTTVTAFYKVVALPEELEGVEMAFNSIGIWFERRDA